MGSNIDKKINIVKNNSIKNNSVRNNSVKNNSVKNNNVKNNSVRNNSVRNYNSLDFWIRGYIAIYVPFCSSGSLYWTGRFPFAVLDAIATMSCF